MPRFKQEVDIKPALRAMYRVTGVSAVKETQLKPGAPATFYWFNLELDPLYNAPSSRFFVMMDADMFAGGNPCEDLEEVIEKEYSKFGGKDDWAGLEGRERYLAVRANAFDTHVAEKTGRKSSTLQTIYGEDIAGFDARMDALQAAGEFSIEAVAADINNYLETYEGPEGFGRQIIAKLKQSMAKNDDGTKSPTDFYEINSIAPYSLNAQQFAEKEARESAEGVRDYAVEVAWEVA